ncbi:MAG: barstar family protein [Tepidisphaeraceae bacterium]
MPTVRLDASRLSDWDAFHTVFASEFGFPDFYGRNMNAWIDCMTDLSEDTGMTSVRGSATDPVVLYLNNTNAVPKEIFEALVECAGFVNWRRLEVGEPAVLILAFHRAG